MLAINPIALWGSLHMMFDALVLQGISPYKTEKSDIIIMENGWRDLQTSYMHIPYHIHTTRLIWIN